MMSAVARLMRSHSRTTDVWVALRQRRTGSVGFEVPKEAWILSWRAANRLSDSASASLFLATVMSTMEPDTMLGGSRMEGNSI